MKLNKFRFLVFFILSILFFQATYADDIAMMGARLSHTTNAVRIVFEFNKAFDYSSFSLSNPSRFVIDMTHAKLATVLGELPLKQQNIIKDVRQAPFDPTTLRIVFDLNPNTKVNSFILKPAGGYSYRLVLDFTNANNASANGISNSKPTVAATPSIAPTTIASNQSSLILGRNIIVVIDPGHGGKDPGATGPHGIHEKNVVLAIGKYIASDIDATPGMTTKMTRYGDYFLTLRDRLQVARQDHADFFVAIHADAFVDREADGASVFALSQRGATSEAARWLAEKDNYSELGGVDLSNTSEVLRSVLIDLSQTATIGQSLEAGKNIVGTLSQISPMHSHHVEQARFVVLKSPDIPSLLVETGFITNPSEEAFLSSPTDQRKVASAIAYGIKEYFMQAPPPNSFFAVEKTAKKYTVNANDTLISIAKHYDTTTDLLMRLNNLRVASVRPGQHILVPTAIDQT